MSEYVVENKESVKMDVRAPLCEIMHQQRDVLSACGDTANIILRLLTNEETLIPKADPKSVVDEASAVLSGLEDLSEILQTIQRTLT